MAGWGCRWRVVGGIAARQTRTGLLPLLLGLALGLLFGFDGSSLVQAADKPEAKPRSSRKFGGFNKKSSTKSTSATEDSKDSDKTSVPEAVEGWEGKADPPPEKVEIDLSKEIDIPFPASATQKNLVLPSQPSSFVAIGSNPYEVWNLGTQTKAGPVVRVPLKPTGVALSPNGQYFAAVAGSGGNTRLGIWTTKTGKPFKELRAPRSDAWVGYVEFAGNSKLVGIAHGGVALVWSLPSGELKQKFSLKNSFATATCCVSPGGRYIVAPEFATRKVNIFDLVKGESVAELDVGTSHGNVVATSFSPDGAELVLLKMQGSKGALLCIDMATGAEVENLELEFDTSVTFKLTTTLKSHLIKWFPDRQRWLLYGHIVVDRKVGQVVWTAPVEEISSEAPRQFLDAGHLLVVAGTEKDLSLISAELPIEEIDSSAKLVALGGSASDAGLPQIKPADVARAKLVVLPKETPWKVQPDPGESVPEQKAGTISLQTHNRGQVGGIWMTAGKQPLGVVWYGDLFGTGQQPVLTRHGRATGPKLVADRIDLSSGETTGQFVLNHQSVVLDVSPDASQILVRTTKPNDRLDLYQLNEEGESIAAWRPYSQEFFKPATEARIIDPTLLVTRNFGGLMITWRMPDCRALYKIEKGGRFELSAGRKCLAVVSEKRVHLLEAETGKCVGILETSGGTTAMAFHPNGKWLATISTDPSSTRLQTWDLTTGKQLVSAYLPRTPSDLQWAGDQSLLFQSGELFDLKQKKIAWRYNLAGTSYLVPGSPTSQTWYLSQESPTSSDLSLCRSQLPDASLARKIAATRLPDESVWKRGTPVKLQVSINAQAPDKPNLAAEVTSHFRQGLEAHGLTVSPAAPLVLAVVCNQANTGETLHFRKIGTFAGAGSTPELKVDCDITLTQAGQVIWKRHALYKNSGFQIVHLKEGEDIGAHLLKQMWSGIGSYLTKFPVPAEVFAETAGRGLGESKLTPASVTAASR